MNLFFMENERKHELLFASLALPIPKKQEWMEKVSVWSDKYWFDDPYRSNQVLPLRNQTGEFGFKKNENHPNKGLVYQWTPAAFPEVILYFEEHVFPWTTSQCRVAILRTRAHAKNEIHIDCAPEKMGTIQHKFRLVLQGRSDTLFFVTASGIVRAPRVESPFLIDGSWPHSMINNDDVDKYTLVLGAPWTSSTSYPKIDRFISKSGLAMDSEYKQYFDPKYISQRVFST